jgi:hypothetical protein
MITKRGILSWGSSVRSLRQRLLVRTVLITVAGILVVAAAVHRVVTSPRRELQQFLRQVATVEIGKTKFETWRIQIGQARFANVTIKCDQRTCGIGLRVENSLLWRLHLAPRTIVDASVGFDDGIASEIYIALGTAKRNTGEDWHDDKGVVVRQSTDVSSACHQHDTLHVKKRYDRNWVTVAMDSCVSPQERAKALAINSSCLTRIGGCKTVEAMIPQVFAPPKSAMKPLCLADNDYLNL